MKPRAKLPHGKIVLLPQNDHHRVLRVGEPERLQQGRVGPAQRVHGRVKRKAQKLIDGQEVSFVAHDLIVHLFQRF